MKLSNAATIFLAGWAACVSAPLAAEEQRACQASLEVRELRAAWSPGGGPLGSAGKDLYLDVKAVESRDIPLCVQLLQSAGVKVSGLDHKLADGQEAGDRLRATVMHRIERPQDARPMKPGVFLVLNGTGRLPPIVSDIEILQP